MNNLLNNWIYNMIINLGVGFLFIFIAINNHVWWMFFFGLFFISRALFKHVHALKNRKIPITKDGSQN